MYRLVLACSALMLAIMGVPAAGRAKVPMTVAERFADPRPIVISHRACWREPAENALEGVAACGRLGVDFVEIDLRKTQDGVIVLLHDDTLDRTTDMTGKLADHRAAEVRRARLRAGQGQAQEPGAPAAPLTRARLPSFGQLLEAAKRAGVFVFLDIKEPIHDHVWTEIVKHGMQDRVLFSINGNFGEAIWQAKFLGHAAAMPKLSQYGPQGCARDADPAAGVALYGRLRPPVYEAVFCDDAFLDAYARAGVPKGTGLWVNTLGPSYMGGRHEEAAVADPEAVWGALLAKGVTAFQTDHPAEMIAWLKARGVR